jgi:two-component system alkaline phosphatase synthesis response regulator PhoP
MKKVLLVEDEESLINVLTLNLEMENYEVVVAKNGVEALNSIDDSFHLVILDVMLPEMNGFDVCAKIRQTSKIPILMISAKGTSNDRITGLKSGADDYLVKPFNLEELLLRVGILIDRTRTDEELESFSFGDNHINFLTYEVENLRNEQFTLSKREVALLRLLISRKNEVVSRDTILDEVWGKDKFPTSRTIDNYIVNFRKYFEEEPGKPLYFKNLRGVGYKFDLKND